MSPADAALGRFCARDTLLRPPRLTSTALSSMILSSSSKSTISTSCSISISSSGAGLLCLLWLIAALILATSSGYAVRIVSRLSLFTHMRLKRIGPRRSLNHSMAGRWLGPSLRAYFRYLDHARMKSSCRYSLISLFSWSSQRWQHASIKLKRLPEWTVV